MYKLRWLVVIVLWCPDKSNAQLNESDTLRFQMRASVSGNYQQGNVTMLSIRSKIDFSFSPHTNWVFKSQNSSLYQSFYGTEADNDIFSRNFFYPNPRLAVYPFAIVYVATNFRRKVRSRVFGGLGITWQAIHQPNHVLKISAGSVYESTQFGESLYNFAEYNGESNIRLWRGTLYAGGWHYILEKRLRLFYDAYWQPAFSNHRNYRTQLDAGIELPVWNGFSFNILYAYAHENLVMKTIQQEDKILNFGIAYSVKRKK